MSAAAVTLRRLDLARAASDPAVAAEVRALFRRGAVPDPRVREGARAILAAVKAAWGDRVTTVFPKQGHYAQDPAILAEYPPADIELARIGDLLACDLNAFLRKT